MKRPVIGVVPLLDIEKESYWMLPGYNGGNSSGRRTADDDAAYR